MVREIVGETGVRALRITPVSGGEERRIEVTGVFVEIGFTPNSALAAHLVDMTDRGEIIVGADCSTRTAGLFAAGDVTNAYGKRVIIACGEGAKAALAAQQYLSSRG